MLVLPPLMYLRSRRVWVGNAARKCQIEDQRQEKHQWNMQVAALWAY